MSDWNPRASTYHPLRIRGGWTVPMSDWNQIGIPVDAGLLFGLNRTYEGYVAFAELIVLYEYYELFR